MIYRISVLLMAFAFIFPVHAKQISFELIPFGVKDPAEISQIELDWNPIWLMNSDTSEYNHNIARIACVLADIAYIDVLQNPKDNMLTHAYIKLGAEPDTIRQFYDINYESPVWGNDQCAFSLAHTDSILFVTIRGTPAGANEWISNLNINSGDIYGQAGDETSLHEGFLKATVLVQEIVRKYIEDEKLSHTETKVLITGHSRGAAVANLLAAKFAVDGDFSPDNMFTYTFAAPNVTTALNTDSPQFDFIWNIVNAEDIVPTVPPNRNEWKFTKYGHILVLSNNWNTDAGVYEEDYRPRINRFFNNIMKRDYCPFGTGPFIPIQLTMLLTSVNKNVRSYYSGLTGIHNRSEKMLKKADDSTFDISSHKDNGMMEKISSFLRERTGGLSDYATLAVNDMHTCETYLSHLAALTEKEAFSSLGSSQFIIKGSPNGFVQDEDGNILLKFEEGRVSYTSIKLPVAARDTGLNGMIIGFPANRNFKIVLSESSIAPTAVKATVEHYNASGILLKTYSNQKFYASRSRLYAIDAGSYSFENDTIRAKTLSTAERKEIERETDILEEQKPRLTFEVNFSTEGHFGYGIHYGPARMYASLLTSAGIFKKGRMIDIQPGIGTQQKITGPLVFDLEGFLKCTWFLKNMDSDKSDEKFTVVPSVRASLSLLPLRRIRIFVSGAADFKIDGFNDYAFNSTVRYNNMSLYSWGDTVHIAPSIQFGIRF